MQDVVRDKIYAIFAFIDVTDEVWVKRFDPLPIKNKVALVNRHFPQYKSAYYTSQVTKREALAWLVTTTTFSVAASMTTSMWLAGSTHNKHG